ncbi:MAG TPA: GNAT family N-acetyltransferase, partial [Candidatus Saccharimonadia bacterium]|nr:GNAT family N-acetyltransferase [Candidatus Saccharimonadia bacterium]
PALDIVHLRRKAGAVDELMAATGLAVGRRIEPLTRERWPVLEALFGRGGASYGCWCMFFRRSSTEVSDAKAADNKADLLALADGDPAPGLLAYDGSAAVGWVGLGPRASFARLVRSRNLKPIDDLPTWSAVCFYITRQRRGEGIARSLLGGAIAYAQANGAPAIEGYARDASDTRLSADGAYPGTVSLFEGAGFREIARYLPPGGATARVTMRRELDATSTTS